MRYTKRMKHLRNLLAVLVLVAVVYLVTNYAGQLQQQIGVKGASTSRAQGIAGQIGNDVGSQVNTVEQQAMHMSLSGALNYFSRFQRVPQDINSIKNYIQSQTSTMLKSDHKK
jgi:sensor domain CHASE-containing protein